eukprot:COSAG06_NODE_61688_length_267_cov_0.607143_1_plen_27_part_10
MNCCPGKSRAVDSRDRISYEPADEYYS